MKVMIDGKIFDGSKIPIHVFLKDSDKKNITDMHPECRVYSEFPDDYGSIEQMENECAEARKKMEGE